jgi:hypothetical protein
MSLVDTPPRHRLQSNSRVFQMDDPGHEPRRDDSSRYDAATEKEDEDANRTLDVPPSRPIDVNNHVNVNDDPLTAGIQTMNDSIHFAGIHQDDSFDVRSALRTDGNLESNGQDMSTPVAPVEGDFGIASNCHDADDDVDEDGNLNHGTTSLQHSHDHGFNANAIDDGIIHAREQSPFSFENSSENEGSHRSVMESTASLTQASTTDDDVGIQTTTQIEKHANFDAHDNGLKDDHMGQLELDQNMMEATKMIRDLEQSLDELQRVQIKNAILMDSLVMVGADF